MHIIIFGSNGANGNMDAIYFEGTEYALPENEFDILPAHRFGGWQIGDEVKQPGDTTQL